MAGRPAMTLLHLGPGLANGLANLHNARRAHTPVLNVVGDHATWHLPCDSPLTSDIAALAGSVGWVHTITDVKAVGTDVARALSAAAAPPGQVATLIVPADLQGLPGAAPAPTRSPPAAPAPESSRVTAAVGVLRRGKSSALYLGGPACRRAALQHVARIADATGCRVFVETFPAHMERGGGTPRVERFGYFPEQAAGVLDGIDHVVLVGAPDPVAMFGWPGAASRMLPEHVQVGHARRCGRERGRRARGGRGCFSEARAQREDRRLRSASGAVRSAGRLHARGGHRGDAARACRGGRRGRHVFGAALSPPSNPRRRTAGSR